jgi:cobalt-zinc-cadmium efflux system outer membrane protein
MDDILSCLKENHYLIRQRDLEAKNIENLSEVLGKRPNPVLDVQTVHAKDSRQTQIMLTQELDFAGRLKALSEKGSLAYKVKLKELALSKEEVVEEVLLNIHHLMHLKETLIVSREVHASLSKVMASLKKRPALAPEQEASLLNFTLQQAEVKNVISLLVDEEEEALLFFYLNGSYKKDDVLKVMEDHRHPLEIRTTLSGLSVNLERLGLETKLAEQELEIQNASPWEGIAIGPMFMDDKLEDISEKLYGVAFTMPIPVWQVNGAGKQLASVTLANTKKQWEIAKYKEDRQKESLLTRINQLKESLNELPVRGELMKTHLRIESLYSRGLITPTSYLDSHRIWRDVTASKLELEEKILKLSIQYYKLSGKLNEVHL